MLKRWIKFNSVGGLGIVVQVFVLATLTGLVGFHYLPSTALAVEAAVLHNFAWHERWTWRDRGLGRSRLLGRLVRFNVSNGALSIVGNLVFMRLLVEEFGVHVLPANLLAIGVCSGLNFLVSDRVVFGMPAVEASRRRSIGNRCRFDKGRTVAREMVLLGITAAMISAGVANSAVSSVQGSVLANMALASKSVVTFEAELVQVKCYPQLSLSDPEEKGHLYVERSEESGTRLRLEIREPEPRTLVLVDGEYVFYQPRIRQALIGKTGVGSGQGRVAFLSYLLGDLTAAEEDFEIQRLGEELIDGRPTVRVRLSAKPASKSLYRRIDLWVRADIWLPVRQELTELNHSLTRIELKNVSINEALDESLFGLSLPHDVERVER